MPPAPRRLELRRTPTFSCYCVTGEGEGAAAATTTHSVRHARGTSWRMADGTVLQVSEADPNRAWEVLQDHFRVLTKSPTMLTQDSRGGTTRRVVCISDTHNLHRSIPLPLPPGDILIHAGDFTDAGTIEEIQDFVTWFESLPYPHKILIAGNHDILLDKSCVGLLADDKAAIFRKDIAKVRKLVEQNSNFIYLSGGDPVTIAGVRIAGFPHTPKPANRVYAFGRKRGAALQKEWRSIPESVDVLVTHCPPVGICDQSEGGSHLGCVDLLWTVTQRVKPSFHVFGHAHSSYGAASLSNIPTTFLNVSTCNGGGAAWRLSQSQESLARDLNPPVVFDVAIAAV